MQYMYEHFTVCKKLSQLILKLDIVRWMHYFSFTVLEDIRKL